MGSVNVYNPGLHDVTLYFSQRSYEFPHGKVTVITDQIFEAPDEYRRNLANGSDEDLVAMQRVQIPAQRFAEMLLNRQNVNLSENGWIISDKAITEAEKTRAHSIAHIFGARIVDEFLQERRERQAGGMGRLAPDPILIDWMIELGVHDPIYNPAPPQPFISDDLLEKVSSSVGHGVVKALEQSSKK